MRTCFRRSAAFLATTGDDGDTTKDQAVISVMPAVADAPLALAWYKRALGATELWNLGPLFLSLVVLGLLASSGQAQAPPRYLIYLHGRIIEDEGRRPTNSDFGTYEYDAILDSLRRSGIVVLSDQRPPRTDSDSFATRVVQQVDSLLRLGVPPQAITVVGFSKGGWIAILASSRLHNPALSFVFMGACGPWAFQPDLHVTGRLLSLYETSDSLGVSCAPMLADRGPGSQIREIPLSLGLGHGTFFQPRSAWLAPVLAWARGRDP